MRTASSLPGNGKTVRLVYLSVGGTNICAELEDACSRLRMDGVGLVLHTFESGETVRDPVEFSKLKDLSEECDLMMINMHGDPSGYRRYDDLRKHVTDRRVNCFLMCQIPESMKESACLFRQDAEQYRMIHRYLHLGGGTNRENLLRYICHCYGDATVPFGEPHAERMQGIYHPGMPRDLDESAYLDSLDPSRPTVGILIGQPAWVNDRLEPHDEMIRSVERHGANTIPVFLNVVPDEAAGSWGIRKVIRNYFYRDGKRAVDSVILCGFGFSTLALGSPGDGSEGRPGNFFEDLDVPVLASLALFRPQEEWRKDGIGMEGGELCISVAMPELDGQLTTVPFVFNEKDEAGHEFTSHIPERIDRIARMAVRWAKLRSVPRKDRRVSILLNASSITNSSIGEAGGLDSLASVVNLLKRMKGEGYTVDHVPSDSRELIDELLANVTNCPQWETDDHVRERAADLTELGRYLEWMAEEGTPYTEWVCRNWGEPVGEIMTVDGRFIVPGVRNGNVYIGYEPPRGKHEQAESLIHDPDLAPPHSYLGYYRWISRVFGTDVHVHIGTHGSAEWLPGKGNGLSRECFPDIMMEDMPHLYLYVIDDPSEGIVAKRRKKSVLVDHLMPSLARAGTYGELDDLEGHVQGLLFAKQTMQKAKADSEAESILGILGSLDMWDELDLKRDAAPEDIIGTCESIVDYIAELKDGLMTNGLHVAGEVPEGEKLDEMIYCLTRLKNGNIPSLRGAIARIKGYDIDRLLDDPSEIGRDGASGAQALDGIDGESQGLISDMRGLEFDSALVSKIISERYGDDADLANVTSYICDQLYPRIRQITDEIDNMIHGMDGGFIPPGPSGSPSRGNAHLLPTGKNYYSLDPETVPTQESWKAGRRMADDMVAKYIEAEGRYPENVGIVVWSIDTMKTGGDDVAYILYLLGVRPLWGSVGGKITGLEVIPHEELGRPRIDVTVRISSLFRDTFPNLFQLIDEAVELASQVEESEDDNYLRKHLREDIARLIEEGLMPKEAAERARIRVFGEPPGVHGAGVNILVESRKWSGVDDLAQMYITFGCSAYGRKWRGERFPEQFRHRLVNLDVAVKNQVDREIDLIDTDDGYSYLGGINTVCRAAGRDKPVNYLCDTSDPDRIKTRDLEHEIAYMLRTRVLNPKWIEGMKEHGFSGANWVHEDINHIFGWDSTSDVIEPWMYKALTDHFLFDEDNRTWIENENPYALRDILDDILEAVDRGMWSPDGTTRERLRDLYLEAEGRLEEETSKKKGE